MLRYFFMLFLIILESCSGTSEIIHSSRPVFEVVILPHHNLTGKAIDDFYKNLQSTYHAFDRIIIIAPDHF